MGGKLYFVPSALRMVLPHKNVRFYFETQHFYGFGSCPIYWTSFLLVFELGLGFSGFYDKMPKRNKMKKEFPILEFDPSRDVKIDPRKVIKPIPGIPEFCVICFFEEAIDKFLENHSHEIIGHIKSEAVKKNIYKVDFGGTSVCLVNIFPGAPVAASYIDEISAYGCRKFLAIGGAGVFDKEIQVGKLMIPVSAVRDEGTSYHYAPPSREMDMDSRAVDVIETYLAKNKIPFIKCKTWTTDAFYRETVKKYELRKSEGCVAVEMECSAFIAVAKYNDVIFGQILYGGDCLDGDEWDKRDWHSREDVRYGLLEHAMKIVQGF